MSQINAESHAPETTTPAAGDSGKTQVRPANKGRVTVGNKVFFWGTGRRKTSVARVRLTVGEGKFLVNDRQVDEFFMETGDRHAVRAPLVAANIVGKLDIIANVYGGGFTGQGAALVQGLGRALSIYDPSLRKAMQDAGFLTRDSRMKERKKYGLRGARRAFQFSKR